MMAMLSASLYGTVPPAARRLATATLLPRLLNSSSPGTWRLFRLRCTVLRQGHRRRVAHPTGTSTPALLRIWHPTRDLRTRTVILRCDSEGDLYLVAGASSTRSALPFAGVVTTDLWHQRLGHSGRAPIAGFEFACTPSSTHSCRACRLDKHTWLPFQQSATRSFFPFLLLHLDI
ncbi:hypothetical protein VPH35_119895 [Triticum aestivum]|uniref:uncharacterized protein n=1 Tax=Triticum aestivum TaxID=4565 RepID=UPI001D002AF0|nr:uncharacterized protein LOC123152317 [Triticum aestivum]XP_044445648.1 uncharacterized protein LOC123172803 [Triticum aestivum]